MGELSGAVVGQVRRALTMADRSEISTGLKAGWSIRRIAEHIGRDPSVISRERARNSTKTRGYQAVHADCEAERNRRRPQARKVDTDPVLKERVLADLKASRTPRQIAGRLHREAQDPTVELMDRSTDAQGKTVSHEAIYQWIYALPKGDLAKYGILLRSKRTRRKTRKPRSENTFHGIVGMVSIDDRPEEATDRRVPGWWEGDLIIGRNGASAAITLVERTSRYMLILGLPQGKDSVGVADALIDHLQGLPDFMRRGLTWDQGTEMAKHASVTIAADLPIYFAHPHSPWERPTNENSNGLVREYLPKGTEITDHQPYLDAIARELNERPRACLGYLTPRERFEALLRENIA